jgi:hypothetical protein
MKLANLKPPTIIFSVFRTERSYYDNNMRSEVLRGLLREFKIGFKDVIGKYGGVIEQSFVVNARHEKLILELTSLAGQDSFLLLDEYRNAYIVDVHTGLRETKPFGRFVHTHLRPEGNYTRDGEHYYEVI